MLYAAPLLASLADDKTAAPSRTIVLYGCSSRLCISFLGGDRCCGVACQMSIRRFLVVVGRVPAAALSHVDITLLN